MRMQRVFAMASKDTFDCEPIGVFVKRYLEESLISVDPFARNKRWATYTNDLNPETKAEYHMKALDFLRGLVAHGVKADLIIFDPPYSMEQTKRAYESYGLEFTYDDSLYCVRWSKEKELCNQILEVNGVFLHFGWHTNGLGKKYNMKLEEILIVAHGSAKYDTLCTAERKVGHQESLFLHNKSLKGDGEAAP